MDKMLC